MFLALTLYNIFTFIIVTSSEVKKRLHEFVISKKQKDHAIASLSGAQAFKHWLVQSDFLFLQTKFIKRRVDFLESGHSLEGNDNGT